MERKVVIAGGTGFIGRYFEKRFLEEGYQVHIISRQDKHLSWLDHTGIVDALDGAEMLINLAGKSVNCRYNKRNKEEIMESRIETTQILGNAMYACENAPTLWINSSTATIYRHAKDRPMTESTGEIGTGFSVEVAKAWEQSLFAFNLPRTRQVALRTAIVLGENGGVMTPYLNMVRFGLGGVQGPGDQMFSWIHIEDLYRIVLFLQDQPQLSGVFNCSAPNPVSNRDLMAELRKKIKRPMGVRAPSWMLEMGAVMIRTETELVLKSRWVLPERLQQAGFKFKYETIDEALEQIVH
ncbi:TIGR01777 family oxidoreductase [Planococcus sp. N028]|uniref:TIGR01777 family oxidoreductase n=1 Tax=Planococcus shixiaomingii TaxID=3058393 RepID=A0ABT8N4V3_9BACL|nr:MULTISPECIES: TIGR01777 family oxidoreductase [unclassified Planococcus (in: firmicutes)]MDN7242920.1 TIGR01777 family oxidoreductase [Planococcus sp. N028]WKA55455.1 TIGR01777 family oxidoreductase [Planococcus sp. N022]